MHTLLQSIADLINKEIHKFAKKVNEYFPQISINEMLSIWCELQQIPSLDEVRPNSLGLRPRILTRLLILTLTLRKMKIVKIYILKVEK
jgi:hypothetical protein